MQATVYLGADHAGFNRKASIADYLRAKDFIIEDLGARQLDPADDYPEYAARVAQAVREHPGSFGILSCGNAEGICIAANKFQGIRAGIGYSLEAARTMRTDDDANIICIPGKLSPSDDPLKIVEMFLATPFSGAERHTRRLKEIAELEK
jgi:ribose 5-phosphate isomerase B